MDAIKFGSELEAEPTRQSLEAIHARITRASRDFNLNRIDVRLICVSKTISLEKTRLALIAGERTFGENRVQEARDKWPALKREFPNVELHLIGPLQSNKVREAMTTFDVIETVDRAKIAEGIARERDRSGLCPKLFVEINTGAERQKAGVLPLDADTFLSKCRDQLNLEIEGLMCIPPETEPKSPHFALLAAIAHRNKIEKLSMGMSADFELAIQLGATHIRLGSAIFGTRT